MSDKCKLCNKGNMVKLRSMIVGDTTYFIMRCDKCNHKIARNQE